MFGYVVPYRPELRVRELALYNGYYCGLCNVLQKDYGLTKRMLLNYDCAFVAALLDGLSGGTRMTQKRCPFKPTGKKRPFAEPSTVMSFAAALNVLLAYYKLEDDWNDEKKASALLLSRVFRRAARKAARKYPKLDTHIRTGLSDLNALESNGCGDIDLVANAFANLLANAIDTAPIEDIREKRALHVLSFNIGRWIYLVDAWHDRERDKKKNDYNVFNITDCEKNRARMLMGVALDQASRAYDLLDIRSNRGLLDNVIYMGCFEKSKTILEPECTDKKCKRAKNT